MTSAFGGKTPPQPLETAASANANTGAVAAVDPNYDLPSNHRWSLGVSHSLDSGIDFFDGWEIRADYIYTEHKNAIDRVDLRLTPNGVTLPDGHAQFFEVDPLLPGCAATFNGIRQGFSNACDNSGPCNDTGNSNQDIGLWEEHELQIYLDIENALNIFSDSNNLRRFTNNGGRSLYLEGPPFLLEAGFLAFQQLVVSPILEINRLADF